MARVYGDIHRALQSYTITYPTPDETLLATPEPLPTSEPAEPQIEFTIGPQHVPVVNPEGLNYVLTAILYAAGKNTDTVSQTVYYRILKNGVSVATGSNSISANYFYTWNHHRFYDAKIGDILACKLWASSANVNWDYKALVIGITRPAVNAGVLREVYGTYVWFPELVKGNIGYMNQSWYSYHENKYFSDYYGVWTFGIVNTQNFGLGKPYLSDYSLYSTICSSIDRRPSYYRAPAPATLSFRPLNLKL